MWKRTLWLGTAIVLLAVPFLQADEGMWLFTNPPTKLLKEKHGFEPTKEWLEHVQKSCVRFPRGSGSFVSPHGLAMTNHHVGLTTLQKLSSTKGRDYVKEGYYARTPDQEVKSVDTYVDVLWEIKDVTKRVKDAVKPDMSPDKAYEARRAVMAQIEKEAEEKTKLHPEVVTLYQGGEYHLYLYKRYTDVRLVFAPEQQIAFYGGDPDNFEYPRYDLDVCFFRIYENDKPLKVEHYLKWSKGGVSDNELVFVAGHPGSTQRLNTLAELDYLRDKGLPFFLERLYRREVGLMLFSARSAENARRAKDSLFSIQNTRKLLEGEMNGLLDPELTGQKKAAEEKLRDAIAANTDLKDTLKAFERIAQAQKVRRKNIRNYTLLEGGQAFNSSLFGIARTLVRAAEELPKPNDQRLEGYTDTALPQLKRQLFSKAPIYDNLEQTQLADSLTWFAELLGGDNKLVKQVLNGKSPQERASELVLGTKLKDIELRKELFKGGKDAISKSQDPMILLAQIVDPESRKLRKIMETEVVEVKRQAYDQIAKAKFAVEGTNTYPDATFTLRLAYGTVKGYEENGKPVPFETTYAGLYERAKEHHNKPPFDLPQRWIKNKDKLNLKTPFNFVCTADIIGGNSGSPVINQNAELVGLIFDGNIQSLVLDFIFTEKQARAVAVCSQAIPEALNSIYDAQELASELTNGNKGTDK
jgi:hypothetical protein